MNLRLCKISRVKHLLQFLDSNFPSSLSDASFRSRFLRLCNSMLHNSVIVAVTNGHTSAASRRVSTHTCAGLSLFIRPITWENDGSILAWSRSGRSERSDGGAPGCAESARARFPRKSSPSGNPLPLLHPPWRKDADYVIAESRRTRRHGNSMRARSATLVAPSCPPLRAAFASSSSCLPLAYLISCSGYKY